MHMIVLCLVLRKRTYTQSVKSVKITCRSNLYPFAYSNPLDETGKPRSRVRVDVAR